jgi:methyl-accepting chemotaxis protein
MNLISDIENASKEQLLGIEQINDAVNQLRSTNTTKCNDSISIT